jgi:hypothetical protein
VHTFGVRGGVCVPPTSGAAMSEQSANVNGALASAPKPKKTVDEIWRELNARPVAGARTITPLQPAASANKQQKQASGANSITIPGLGTVVARVPPPPSKPATLQPAATATLPDSLEDVPIGGAAVASGRAPPGVSGGSSRYDPSHAGVSDTDLSAYLATIQRQVNCLTDPDRSTRRTAAAGLRARLAGGVGEGGPQAVSPPPNPALLQALLEGPLQQPLLGLLADVVEKCR